MALKVRAMVMIWVAAVCILGLAMQCSAETDWSPPAPPTPMGCPPANSPYYFRGYSPDSSPAGSPYSAAPEYSSFGAPGPAPEGYPVPQPTSPAYAPQGYPVVSPVYAPTYAPQSGI